MQQRPEIGQVVAKLIVYSHRPLIAEVLAINVHVWRGNKLVVRISVRRPPKIEPDKGNDLSSSILIGALPEIDPASVNV